MRVTVYLVLFFSLISCAHKGTRIPASQISCNESLEVILRNSRTLNSVQKARAINDLEGSVKGSFAEIGAGQGISAKFFEAKRASETVVKTISAYGKEESDRLYGGGVRYVSEQRLNQMLEKEFATVLEHKSEYKRGVKVFAIANTVTSNVDGSGHGWLGIKFADLGNPRGAFQEIKIHLNFGKTSLEKQHAELGKLGVNLIHYLFSGQKIPAGDELIEALFDGVKKNTISLDSIEWSKGMRKIGIPTVDLVDKNVADFVIFDPKGKSLTGKDLFFRKNVLAFEDGAYNPSSSQYLNLRMVNWPELLEKFNGDKKRAISHLRSKLRKGDHVVLTGKNGKKGFQDYLSSTMNSSNTVILNPADMNSKSPAVLKKYLARMRERKLLPAIKQLDLDSFNESHYRVLKDLEARSEVIILP